MKRKRIRFTNKKRTKKNVNMKSKGPEEEDKIDYEEEEIDIEEEERDAEVEEDLEEALMRRGEETNEALLKLPLDIFLHILTRLSVKPLGVCRCVCKTWRTVIHHPRLTNLHHHIRASRQTHNYLKNGITTSILYQETQSNNFHLYEVDDCIDKKIVLNPPLWSPNRVLGLVGSCNGFLCLSDESDPVYVWNPVIGEYTTLPICDNRKPNIVSGFGFDEVANEYKVIRMIPNGSKQMQAEIYTLGSGQWRKLGDVPFHLRGNSSQAFVNGALHWMTDNNRVEIVAFSVGIEKFQVAQPQPDLAYPSESPKMNLGNLGGFLCLFDHSFSHVCNIWRMRGQGPKYSWSKDYAISRKVKAFNDVFFRPITMLEDGKILLVVNGESMFEYDPVRKSFRKLVAFPQRSFNAITHVGSFLSFRDVAQPSSSTQRVSTGRWYGTLRWISSKKPNLS